jgi:hypothetical protein
MFIVSIEEKAKLIEVNTDRETTGARKGVEDAEPAV